MSWGVPSAIPHFPTSNQVFTKNSKKNTRFYKMHHKEAKLTCSHFQWIWISWQRIWHFWRIIYILHDILQHQHRVVWVFLKDDEFNPTSEQKLHFWHRFVIQMTPKNIFPKYLWKCQKVCIQMSFLRNIVDNSAPTWSQLQISHYIIQYTMWTNLACNLHLRISKNDILFETL